MEKKKILIFSTAYYPFIGGAEVAVKEITDRLSDDFEFDLITARMRKNLQRVEKVGAVTVHRIGWGNVTFDKILLPFFGAVYAWKLQSRKNFFCYWGIMATFGSGAGYLCNIFRKILGKKKIPIILTLQEGDSEEHLRYSRGGLIALSWRLALWQTDFLTAISSFLLDRGQKFGYHGRMKLVPNGAPVKLFSEKQDETAIENLKQMLGKKSGDIFLVTVSRLSHKNAVDDIISALTCLPAHISLIIIGKGEEGTRLQAQVNTLGLGGRVKFVGFVSYLEVPKYLAVCDIFVRPSRSEGFGNSFIEAMAAGLPVIATPVGGIPDFIDDKKTGVFCSPDNPHSIAEAVKFILDNETMTQEMIRRAYQMVVERYDWSHIAMQMKTEVFDILQS